MNRASVFAKRWLVRAFVIAAGSFLPLSASAKIGVEYQMALGNPSSAVANAAERTNYLIARDQYALSYNDDTHQANWVSWSFTSADDGSASRTDAWAVETALPSGYLRIGTSSFGTGWDRGHMCPSADRTTSTADNEFTFRMSNIIPQASSNNQGLWATFETYCRGIAADGSEIMVISGPSAFGGTTISNGMWIPGSVWKIAVKVPGGTGTAAERINAGSRVIALLTPNTSSGLGSWQSYITSVEQIEEVTGLEFFNNVSPPVATYLKNVVDTGTGPNNPTVITSFTPASGAPGTSVSISGYNFGASPVVRFDGTASTFVSVINSNLLTAIVPTGATSGDITVTGTGGTDTGTSPFTVLTAAVPSLALSVPSLGGFTANEGSASSSQSYTVTGSNLTGTVTLTASGPFEISLDNLSFSPSLTLDLVGGMLAGVPVHVRTAAGALSGTANGSITHSGGGATSLSLALSGSITSLSPTLALSASSLSGFSAFVGNPGASKSYTVSGNNLTGDVLVSAPAGFELSLDDLSFTSTLTLSPSGGGITGVPVHVRLQASALTGAVGGSITHAGGGASTQFLLVTGSVNSGSSSSVTLAAWETTGLSGYGPSPFAPDSADANVLVTGLTRGPGVTLTGTAAGSAWGGSGFDGTAALADAITRGDYITFGFTANAGVLLGFTRIPAYNIRHSSAGPLIGQWQYQVGTGAFVNVGPTLSWGAVTSSAGNPQAEVDLSGYPDLQNVLGGTSVTFRLVTYGASSSGGTFYINNISGNDLAIVGTISSAVTTTPVITSAETAGGTAFEPFTYQITATNNPTSYSAIGLPDGLSLDSQSGLISGTPTFTGTYSINLTASNGDGDGTATLVLSVDPNPGAPAITSPLLAEARLRSSFSYTITSTNNPTALLATGLPAGLVIDTATGLISGTPTSAGVYPVLLSVQNSLGTDNRTLTLTVLDPTLTPSLASLPPMDSYFGSVSVAATYQLTGSGLAGPVNLQATDGFELAVDGGDFSTTATITPANGSITEAVIAIRIAAGAPLGVVSGSVIHSGGGAVPKYVELNGTVSAPVPTLAVAPTSLEPFTARVGDAPLVQSYTLSGVNLSGPVTVSAPMGFEVSGDGELFSGGLTLAPFDGIISSVMVHVRLISTSVAASFAGTILHGGGGAVSVGLPVSGTVSEPVGPVITSTTSGSVYVGSTFNHAITVEGSPQMVGYSATNLPPGLTFNSSTGVITGAPNVAGTSIIGLSATSTEGTTSGSYTLRVVSSAEQSAIPVSVVVNKFFNGTVDQVELLVTGDNVNGPPVDMRGMILKDFNSNMGSDLGGRVLFQSVPFWSSVKAGTLIVLSTGSSGVEDLDASDFVLRLNLANTQYFELSGGFDIGTTEMVLIKSAGSGVDGVAGGVHALAAGSSGTMYSQFTGRRIRASRQLSNRQGNYAYVINNSAALADFYQSGGADTASSLTFGSGNNSTNTNYINTLRGLDQTPPVVTLAGADPLFVPHNGVFTDPGATALDNVGGSRLVTVSGTVNPSAVGSYVLTYSASDAAGNSTAITRAVFVTDQTPPLITLNGSGSIIIGTGSSFVDPGASAVDAVDGVLPVSVSGSVNTSMPGAYLLVYQAADTAGNQSQSSLLVTVIDQTPPIVTLTGLPSLRIPAGETFIDPGATAIDAVDGVLAVQITGMVNPVVPGTYTLGYTATDAAGNTSAPVERTVTVVPAFEYAMVDEKGLAGSDALPGADPDHDGFTNLQEFAFGLDPTAPGGQLIRSEVREGMLRIRFLKRSGVNYSVESSADLQVWTSGVPSSASETQPAVLPDGYTEYEAALPVGGARTFLRVGVSLP